MIGDLAADELGLAGVAGALVVGAGELDRRLHGLRAARGEEDAIQVARRQRRDPSGELDRPRVRVAPDGEEVELRDLARRGVAELRPAVAGVDAEEGREAVQIAVALLVPDVGPLAADDDRDVGVVVGAVPREVHPQVALGELLEIRGGGRHGCAGSCHLGLSSRPATACPTCIDVPYNGSRRGSKAQPGLGSKMLPGSCTNRTRPLFPFWGFCPLRALSPRHTLVGLSG